jgi:hypothetical protein
VASTIEEDLGEGQVVVDALIVLAAHGVDDVAPVIMLVLGADRDLRQPVVLVVERIAVEFQLRAYDVLVEGEAVAQA